MFSLSSLKLTVDKALEEFLKQVENCYLQTDYDIPWSRKCFHEQGSSIHHQMLDCLIPQGFNSGELSNVHLLSLCLLNDSQLVLLMPMQKSVDQCLHLKNDLKAENDGDKTMMVKNAFTENDNLFDDPIFEESSIEFRNSLSSRENTNQKN